MELTGDIMRAEGKAQDVFRDAVTYTEESPLVFEKAMFLAFMNHQFEGGGFRFCPQASAGDGYLDLCLPDNISTGSFFKLFPLAAKGRHTTEPGICIMRTKCVHIRSRKPLWVHTDGEVWYSSNDITVSIAKDKLQLLI